MALEDAIIERWTFGGSRVLRGKRKHVWTDEKDKHQIFDAKGSYSVGTIYDCKIERSDDSVSMWGTPSYSGDVNPDHGFVENLWALHRAAEMELSEKQAEKRVGQDDYIQDLCDRLAKAANQIPYGQRAGFAAYVLNRILKGY